MEEELSRLQSQNTQLSKGKSERDVEANELQAKLRSADEKVLHQHYLAAPQQMLRCTAEIVICAGVAWEQPVSAAICAACWPPAGNTKTCMLQWKHAAPGHMLN